MQWSCSLNVLCKVSDVAQNVVLLLPISQMGEGILNLKTQIGILFLRAILHFHFQKMTIFPHFYLSLD